MACGGIDPQNIYLWLTIAGVFSGGGLSFLAAPSRRRNLAAALILFSVAVLSVLCGIILAEIDLSAGRVLLIWLGACFIIGYSSFLFWKFLGVPVFFIVIIFISSIYYSLYDWSCLKPESEICRIRMLSEGEDSLRIQYEGDGIAREVEVLDGLLLSPVVEQLEIPTYFFIIGAEGLYRFNGFSGNQQLSQVDEPGFIVKSLLRLPGFSYGNLDVLPVRLNPSIEYSLIINSGGMPEVLRLIE